MRFFPSAVSRDPWKPFAASREVEPAAVAVVAEPEEPEPPSGRVTLRTTDGGLAAGLGAGWFMVSFLCVIAAYIAGFTGVDLVAAGVGAIGATGAAAYAAFRRFGRPWAEFELDERGISQRTPRAGGSEVTTLISWSQVVYYRDAESLDHAYLRVVGTHGQVITLRQASPDEEMYQLIRAFVARAERRGARVSRPRADVDSHGLAIAGTLVLLVVMEGIFAFLPGNAEEIGTALLLVPIAAWNAYAMLTDDDLALEDRASTHGDARFRDGVRRLLRIETV